MQKFDKAAYDKAYYKEKIIRKVINFNRSDPADLALLEWLEQQPNATQYIKSLIRADMHSHER